LKIILIAGHRIVECMEDETLRP